MKLSILITVMDTFENWLKDNPRALTCLSEEVKIEACNLLPLANNCELTRVILNTCHLAAETDRMLVIIHTQLESKKYKEVKYNFITSIIKTLI